MFGPNLKIVRSDSPDSTISVAEFQIKLGNSRNVNYYVKVKLNLDVLRKIGPKFYNFLFILKDELSDKISQMTIQSNPSFSFKFIRVNALTPSKKLMDLIAKKSSIFD